MVIDISEQIRWFRRVTHEDCAHGWTVGAKGTATTASENGGEEGTAHFKRMVQRTEKCGLFHRVLHKPLFDRVTISLRSFCFCLGTHGRSVRGFLFESFFPRLFLIS